MLMRNVGFGLEGQHLANPRRLNDPVLLRRLEKIRMRSWSCADIALDLENRQMVIAFNEEGMVHMARKPKIDEASLTKMDVRKLNALRKSIGDEIGEKAFAEWLKHRPAPSAKVTGGDKTADAIAGAVMGLIEAGTIKGLPRGGYVVKRGRGRVVASRAG